MNAFIISIQRYRYNKLKQKHQVNDLIIKDIDNIINSYTLSLIEWELYEIQLICMIKKNDKYLKRIFASFMGIIFFILLLMLIIYNVTIDYFDYIVISVGCLLCIIVIISSIRILYNNTPSMYVDIENDDFFPYFNNIINVQK